MLTSSTSLPPLPTVRCEPICPYFFACGGCDIQDLPYTEQVSYKEKWLRELFAPLASPGIWRDTLASEEKVPVYFRNKIRFGLVEHNGLILPSRHKKGEEAADIPVDACFLQSPEALEITAFTGRFAQEHGWSIYQPTLQSGAIKHLLIRQGKFTGETMVALVTDSVRLENLELWQTKLIEKFPQITSLYLSQTWGKNNTTFQDRLLWGTERITEKVGDYTFHISPHAFFQTNSTMLHTLYQAIGDTAALSGQEIIWDLYAGSATIGIFLSQQAQQVLAIENNPANITDAQINLDYNKIGNVELQAGRVEDVLTSSFLRAAPKADVIIVDPPRAGLSERIRNLLPHLKPHRLVYVSCNPITCLRDCQDLLRHGYQLDSLQAIDMFPHTLHCELIAQLRILES